MVTAPAAEKPSAIITRKTSSSGARLQISGSRFLGWSAGKRGSEVAESTISRRIDVATGVVWDVLADFGALADWAPRIDHVSMTTQSTGGVGATRRVQSGRVVLLERVVEWIPGECLAYDIEGLPRIVGHARNRWQLEPSAAGTLVSLTSSVDAGSRPPGPLVARLAVKGMGRVGRGLVGGFARHLEGGMHG